MKVLSLLSAFLSMTLVSGEDHHLRASANGGNSFHRDLTSSDTFCWKHTYGRGVGTIPNACENDKEQIGALCYSRCPDGYSRSGVDCHQQCPSGMEDQGLYCRRTEYGRGAGYPWHFGDGLNNHGMIHRCEHDHGEGNCEMSGDIAYPKCKSGYYAVGCCICRPHTPDCSALGLGSQLDLSCAKKIELGKPVIKNGCPSGKENNAGLCYHPCKQNYHGLGPVCWGEPPMDWVDCGAGAADNVEDCAHDVTNQVTSVFQLAINIALKAFGDEIPPEDLESITEFKGLVKQFKNFLNLYPEVKKQIEAGNQPVSSSDLNDMETMTNPADIVRMAAKIAAIFDPTGIAGVVSSYSWPTCDKIVSDE